MNVDDAESESRRLMMDVDDVGLFFPKDAGEDCHIYMARGAAAPPYRNLAERALEGLTALRRNLTGVFVAPGRRHHERDGPSTEFLGHREEILIDGKDTRVTDN
jgi:hypothetical protein